MAENRIPIKPVIVSSLVGGVAMGALEYASYNRRLFNSDKLSERQFVKIAESLIEKVPAEKAKIINLKDTPEELCKYVFEKYKKCCNDNGKLIHDSNKISKESFDAIKSSLNKMRMQQSLLFGGLFALGCAAFSLITNKIADKKSTQVNKKV